MLNEVMQTGQLLLASQEPMVLAAAATAVLLLAVVLHHARKIRQLQQQLIQQDRFLRQELKMMNQGAIGVGNRVKTLEKQVRTQPSEFEQRLLAQASVAAQSQDTRPNRPSKSRAEQALADWMKDYRTPA
ncbi:hypothetical protein [Saccharospirillum mangrovi]|uniref:hypothetical protein n=1 Tax=Saccharospirillum mangrovi TaxID=2161747 RepID=UPI000D3A256D|nr:hypothetical protein [Saccharospirillum mangrovi]